MLWGIQFRGVLVAIATCLILAMALDQAVYAATLPDQILYQDGYSVVWQGTESFNEDLRDYFTVIGGNTTDAGLVQQLRSEGKIFAYNVGYNPSFTTQQLVDLWSVPFNNTLGGALPGGFDAIEIDEILPYANGTVESNRIVGALAQLRAEYPDKIIATFTAQELGWNPATYSNLWNGINNYADLNLFEAYIDERAAPGNVLWHANMAILIDNQTPGLIDKTIFALLSYQGAYPADTTTDIGFWGFLDAQMHAIRNHPVASRMPGVGSYTYTLGLTTDFMGRAMDHYYIQGNTDYFGDGDMTQAVSNPQFENSTAGWDLAMGVGGWVGIFNYNGEPVSSTHDLYNRTSHGNYGLKTIRGSTANEISFAATVEAGLTYNISANVHAGAGGDLDDAKVQIMTDSGNLIAERLGSQITEPSGWLAPWRAITFNFVVNPGQEDIRIVLTDDAANPGDVFYWDFVQMEDGFVAAGPVVTDGIWAVDASGNWSDGANWTHSRAPGGAGATIFFGHAITTPRTVFLDADVTISAIGFDSSYAYTIFDNVGFRRLTLQSGTGSVPVDVYDGQQQINARVSADSNLNVNVLAGSLSFSDVSSLELNAHTLTKSGMGALHLGDITGGGNVIIQQGQLFFDGMHSDGGWYGVQAGAVLVAEGLIIADVFNSGMMTVGPAGAGGSLIIAGDYTTNGGLLQLELGGNIPGTFDSLTVGGDLVADGSMRILLVNGFTPQAGDRFELLSFAASSGSFETLDLPDLDAALSWNTSDLLVTGMLEVIAASLWGDANNDGLVSGADLIAVQQNFGSTGEANGLMIGDANGDGLVTGADLIAVQQNFAQIAVGIAVPEPATLGLLWVMVAAILHPRRSSRRSIDQKSIWPIPTG